MKIYNTIMKFWGKLHPIEYCRKKGMKIGSDCRFVSLPSIGSEPYLIEIGDHVNICSDVTFINHDGGTWIFRNNDKFKNVIKFGAIKIGNNCFIGTETTIMPGVTIGDNCVVGAKSLVTKDVKSGSVVAGVPARYICSVEEYKEKCLKNTPEYDIENYRKDKRKELIKIYLS